ncbi:phosphoenolpyruvate--protein phosphotransferase [Thermodesulfobacteriota bacterium]
MVDTRDKEIHLHGISGSPGICIGKAYLVGREGVDVVEKYVIKKKGVQNEVKRFKKAANKAMNELQEIIENTPKGLRQHISIIETHMLLLKDKMLYGKTIENIKKERVNAEWALKKTVSDAKSLFQDMADSYLRERALDIEQVSDRIIQNLVGIKKKSIGKIDKRVILVAHDLSPAETSQIQLEKIKGFVTDRGGKTSHTGIIARTLEIPAVLGIDNASRLISNDDIIIVDGTAGIVIINPSEQTLIQFEERQAGYEAHKAVITRDSDRPAETGDGFRLQVMGNIELPEEVVSVHAHGGDGIGLYRTEFQYLSHPDFPSEDELFDNYKDIVEVMAPKPVTIRTLDINGDKMIARIGSSDEPNPALGLRGIRYCLQRPDIFKTQLRAILRASAFGNVRILLPMVSCHEEIQQAKKMLREVADSLDQEGVNVDDQIQVGIMIEVPSAAIMADVMAKDVDFFSIGTNDLIQYSLAVDRGNSKVAHLYQPFHPAILRLLKHVTEVARDHGVKVSICGQMAGDPVNIPILLGFGINNLSMTPQSIPVIKSVIRSLKVEDARMFIKEALKEKTDAGVTELVMSTYGDILFDLAYTE